MLTIKGQPVMDAHPSDALAEGTEKILRLIEAERESLKLMQRREMDHMEASNKAFQHDAYLAARELKRRASASTREAETWKEEAVKARQKAYAAQQELARVREELATEKRKVARHEHERSALAKKNVELSVTVWLLKDRAQALQQKADEQATGFDSTNTRKRSATPEPESTPEATKRGRTDGTAEQAPIHRHQSTP
ncbi:hypothetical protein BD410DRAFT_837374 [Rickenella mellea]|uniref:Uncharacterized protein n=1 Tax=Rickenella mellea TaxID=50990 RepID=A0A4Y7QE37_9AGAM|nr:hypothetical protein BD410DRAFT_837374 [Rickenella mellea]